MYREKINRYFYFFIVGLVAISYGAPARHDQERRSSFPYISGDSFRAIADHIFDETDSSLRPEEIRNSDIIFVKTDCLDQFFNHIHPRIRAHYILITHNADEGAPGIFESFLNDPKLIVWFGQNSTIYYHPKFIPIPIGLANNRWGHGNINTFKEITALCQKPLQKPYLLGLNFIVGTNDKVRRPIFDNFSQFSFTKNICSSNHRTYLINMMKTKFIVSPHGNGLDCHRTWEALLVNCIPIVKSSTLDDLYKDLPIVIVHDWSEVTEEFLITKYEEIQHNWPHYHWNKIYFTYWDDLIRSYKK